MSLSRTCQSCGSVLSVTEAGRACVICDTRQSLGGKVTDVDGATQLWPPFAISSPEQLDRIGDYELLNEIASGGMGVVHRARQISLNRIVALKMIRGERLAGAPEVRRFILEAQAAASLQHPNIVGIHEVGSENGQHFYVMDYVEGVTLAHLVRDDPLPPRRAAEYLRKVALAMHYAHRAGVLHRDLKPGNILIDRDDEPRITDFGLAKLMHSDSQQTLSGVVMGTPSYMSPEQAAGRANALSARSDVYSLGSILYELVTGRPPFRADTTMATLKLVLEAEPVPPKQLNAKIPADIDTICLKCLDKSPAKRYATAADLAEDLARFLNHEPIKARPVGAPQKAWRWCKRKPALAATGGATLLLLLTVAIGSPIAAYKLNQARLESERRELTTRRNAYAADLAMVHQALENRNYRHALTLLRAHRPQPGQADVRGWEWRYYWQLCQGDEARVLTRHAREVYSLDLSRTGKWLISQDHLGETRLFDLDGGREVLAVTKEQGPLAAVSPNDAICAVPFPNGRVRFWSLPEGKELPGVLETGGPLQMIRFESEGRLQTLSDGFVQTWEIDSGLQIAKSPLPPLPHFCPSEDWLMWAMGDDKSVSVYDLGRGLRWKANTEFGSYAGEKTGMQLAISPDRKTVAVGLALSDGAGFTIQLRDAETGVLRTSIASPYGPWINRIAFSPDGAYLATTSNDQSVQVWDLTRKQILSVLKGHNASTYGAVFSPDRRFLFSSGADGTVRQWKFGPIRGTEASIKFDTFTSDSLSADKSFLVIGQTNEIVLVDLQPLQIFARVPLPTPDVTTVAAGPKARLLAFGTPREIAIWDVLGAKVSRELKLPGSLQLAFSPNENRLAVQMKDDRFEMIHLATGEPDPAWQNRLPKLATFEFSIGSQLLGSGHTDGSVKVWSVKDATLLATLPTPRPINQIAFSSNGVLVAASSQDATVRVWNWKTREQVATFSGGHSSYYTVCFSPDNDRLFVNEWLNAYLFDMHTGRQVAQLSTLRPVFVDRDSVSGLNRTAAWVWRPPSLQQIDAIENR